MLVHGQSAFEVFAKPVVSEDGTSVRYDGFATFTQGDLQFTYVLVDGKAYIVETTGNGTTSAASKTIRCLESITPFDSIVAALNTLKIIPRSEVADDFGEGCGSGTLLQTTRPFGGVNFSVCALGADGFVAYGGSMIMQVEYDVNPYLNISTPAVTDGSATCGIVSKPTPVTSTTLALLIGAEV
ncbi:unnamed protein product [Phytophthora lilii]|uniref:Unnamed protein product n=1 Tax=Phytophthora lilii TaxID=2077276 RepID=A0A9W6XDV8_9STRA|nr:unnamed protein product [Phytophthora lilii]